MKAFPTRPSTFAPASQEKHHAILIEWMYLVIHICLKAIETNGYNIDVVLSLSKDLSNHRANGK